MEIGTIIKKYRRERDMTQEQLAEYLRVSVSAVSQWESGKTAPDLATIPAICNLFGISADELLGIDREHKQEKIDEILENASRYSDRGYMAEAEKVLEAGLREYPDSYDLMESLMDVKFDQRNWDEVIRLEPALWRDVPMIRFAVLPSSFFALPINTRGKMTRHERLPKIYLRST